MRTKIILAIVVVILIGGAFFAGTQVNKDSSEKKTSETLEHSDKSHSMNTSKTQSTVADHVHDQLEIDPNLPVPSAEITVTKDTIGGYNLKINTTDFKFTPENVNMANATNAQNEGHAHLYINHTKITRVYGNYFYISNKIAMKGDKVMITLNTNKHEDIVESNNVTLD